MRTAVVAVRMTEMKEPRPFEHLQNRPSWAGALCRGVREMSVSMSPLIVLPDKGLEDKRGSC
jgi:hypothetical protein